MASHLLTLKIRGIRSYSPFEEQAQTIEFMPLTLIIGNNGTGKTTIIEALKFMIGGEEPPRSDSRRNFVHSSTFVRKSLSKKKASSAQSYGFIELKFIDYKGKECVAKRELTEVGSKNSPPSICSSYQKQGGAWITVNSLVEWSKSVPLMFGLQNPAILNYVIMCHQEDNLWCMGDSASVKLIFDKIFGCQQYKKELKHIDDEIRSCKRDIELTKKDLEHRGVVVKQRRELVSSLEKVKDELSSKHKETMDIKEELVRVETSKKCLAESVEEHENNLRTISSLKQRVDELTERETVLRRSLQPFLDKTTSLPERRMPPPPPSKPKRKSQKDQDPTAVGLNDVVLKLGKMSSVVDRFPETDDVRILRDLISELGETIKQILARFNVITEEEDKEKEDDEEARRKWYEEQEALSREAEARRIQRDKEIREQIEKSIKENEAKLVQASTRLKEVQEKVTGFEDYEIRRSEILELDKKISEIRNRKYLILGASQQLEREMKRYERELNSKSYQAAFKNYAESMSRLVCNRAILEDLEKLKLCILKSISSFHDRMLNKINYVLQAKWKKIYQGGDIESIEVVADEIKEKQRGYNYQLVMRKNGTIMVMREKSSAGQRALAAIILRMTLAELFVKEFSFIALDEPTANLDENNVRSLARSIGAYVQRRAAKGIKLQSIIITHDEEFLRALNEECSPYYYRTTLNQDGLSQINKCHTGVTCCD